MNCIYVRLFGRWFVFVDRLKGKKISDIVLSHFNFADLEFAKNEKEEFPFWSAVKKIVKLKSTIDKNCLNRENASVIVMSTVYKVWYKSFIGKAFSKKYLILFLDTMTDREIKQGC